MEQIKQMAILNEHIERIEDHLTQLIGDDEALSQRYQTMQTAPGMGEFTRRPSRAEGTESFLAFGFCSEAEPLGELG
jgi:hypothetical protein